ncbi:class I SAM-dependent methyltransferase [Halothiobacillus sp. DCM-1]|uniref:class I SAM-dependent methyltransferase n=1 Tax=Halothiobacillus sp. DCM-1 TaxID=3112558 RepID=UPI00324AD78D
MSDSHLDDLSFAKLNGEKLLNLVSGWLPVGGRILDFGAGSGFLVKQLLDRGYSVAAFDPAGDRESTLMSLVGHYDRFLGLERGEDGRQYDVVIFSEVIEHISDEDYEVVLTSLSQFVREDGVLILTTPNQEDIDRKMVFCPACEHMFHPWQHMRSMDPSILVSQLGRHGFTKQFLGLVDFSNDAISQELGGVASRLLDQIDQINQVEGFDFTEILKMETNPSPDGMLGDFFRSLGRLLVQGTSIVKSPSAEQEVNRLLTDAFNAISEVRIRQNRLTRPQPTPLPVSSDASVDFSYGNGSTIVYVGKKSTID